MKISMLYEMLAHHYINKKRVTIPADLSGGGKLLILATGKSANGYWNDPECRKQFEGYDVLVMNRSIYKMEEEIFALKPRYFAACDSIYWGDFSNAAIHNDLAKNTYRRTKEILEKIDWDMNLITTIHENFDFVNDKIHVIRLNAASYCSGKERDYALYRGNFCSPHIYNVAQLAIYFGITFGYRELALVGIDFDFIKNISCDEKCRVGLCAEHQYDVKGGTKIEVIFDKEKKGQINGSVLAKYLLEVSDTISSFGKLALYAEKQECRIINYSTESLLDCYEKRSLKG